MFKKFASLALVATLICTLGGTPAFAQTSSQPLDVKSTVVNDPPDSVSAGKKVAQPSEGLKANIQKLVADARAGKGLGTIIDPQNQPRQSNNLSKSVKIGLIVGVAAAVILIIVFIKAKNDFNPFG